MSSTLLQVLQSLIAFQGLLFATHLLVAERGKRLANRALAALLGVLAFHMLANVARGAGYGDLGVAVAQVLALLYGPLFFLYVRALLYEGPTLGPEELLHAVPCLTVGALAAGEALSIDVIAAAIFASVGTYLALSWLALARYARVVEQTRSDSRAVALRWLRWAMTILTAVWLLDMASYAGPIALPAEAAAGVTVLLFSLLLVFVTALVLEGLRHPQLFAGITAEDEAIAKAAAEDRHGPGLAEDDVETRADVERLQRLIDDERPFLDPDLTIAALADRVGIPARRLSRLVNGHFGTNFSDFVNTYRIAAAAERLRSPGADEQNILDLLYAVGFNSKSAFNTAFKKKTGLTPSEYRRRHGS